jgi:hypothetical protein
MAISDIDPFLLKGIDQFIRDGLKLRDQPITVQEAIDIIIRDWLIGHGYLELISDENGPA